MDTVVTVDIARTYRHRTTQHKAAAVAEVAAADPAAARAQDGLALVRP